MIVRRQSYGEEQAVLLDPLDYQLLQDLAGLGSGLERPEAEVQDLLRRYLENEISLAKMAGTLGLSRFELMERSERLGGPLRTGPADLQEAREEVGAARSSSRRDRPRPALPRRHPLRHALL